MAALSGLQGVKRGGQAAPKPAPRGALSAKTAADNASFDRSCYQGDVSKSMVGGKLR
jgi:hypothetical protein